MINIYTKYIIQDYNFYNFDETNFTIDMIRFKTIIIRFDRIGKPKAIQPDN